MSIETFRKTHLHRRHGLTRYLPQAEIETHARPKNVVIDESTNTLANPVDSAVFAVFAIILPIFPKDQPNLNQPNGIFRISHHWAIGIVKFCNNFKSGQSCVFYAKFGLLVKK